VELMDNMAICAILSMFAIFSKTGYDTFSGEAILLFSLGELAEDIYGGDSSPGWA
jgi:hypothetical protein